MPPDGVGLGLYARLMLIPLTLAHVNIIYITLDMALDLCNSA